MIPLDLIEPDPGQPRKEFDSESLAKLADSLRKRGQIQPVMVCWSDSQAAYVILTGERRWRAARQAGMEKLACIVRDQPMSEGELRAVQLIENCLREDLKPLEQAHAYRDLMASNEWSAGGWPRSWTSTTRQSCEPWPCSSCPKTSNSE